MLSTLRLPQRLGALALLAGAALGAACSGSGGTSTSVPPPTVTPSPTPTPTPTPTATATPVSAAIVLKPASLSFTATGAANALPFTASETGFTGTFTVTTPATGTANSCNGIATVAPASGTGAFTVTAAGNGHCTFSVSDGTTSATETIDVTTTTVGGS